MFIHPLPFCFRSVCPKLECNIWMKQNEMPHSFLFVFPFSDKLTVHFHVRLRHHWWSIECAPNIESSDSTVAKLEIYLDYLFFIYCFFDVGFCRFWFENRKWNLKRDKFFLFLLLSNWTEYTNKIWNKTEIDIVMYLFGRVCVCLKKK